MTVDQIAHIINSVRETSKGGVIEYVLQDDASDYSWGFYFKANFSESSLKDSLSKYNIDIENNFFPNSFVSIHSKEKFFDPKKG